jgi:hypothetical protein
MNTTKKTRKRTKRTPLQSNNLNLPAGKGLSLTTMRRFQYLRSDSG